MEYRRGPGLAHPAAVDDVVSAAVFVCSRRGAFGLDAHAAPTLLGFSAGGQLALQAALRLAQPEPGLRPRCVVAVAPVADLALAKRLRLSDDGDAVEVAFSPEVVREACPTRCAERFAAISGSCRLVVVAGTRDVDVPIEVVNSFRGALRKFAREGGEVPENLDLDADHYQLMDAGHAAWKHILPSLLDIDTAEI